MWDPSLSFQTRVAEGDVRHALDHALGWFDLDADADPPKALSTGPDRTGNLLEVILLEFADDRWLVIHAMALRRSFYDLLPRGTDDG